MFDNPRRLRRPEERVGKLSNADLPPPVAQHDADAELVQRLRARDEQAFARLFDLHYSAMQRVAMSFVRSPEEAEEVIQDTWVAVLSGIHRFQGRSSFKTWLFRILANRARDRGAREARLVSYDVNAPQIADAASAAPDPEASALSAELRELLESSIATLPRNQRLVVTLRDVEGWSGQEVRETFKFTEANQRVLLHRARLRIREQLAPYLESAMS